MWFRRSCWASPNIRSSTNTICVTCTRSSRALPRSPSTWLDAASARLGCRVVQGYGLTETSPVTHATRIDRTAAPGTERFKTAGIGPPIANTEAKVVDVTTGAELGPTQEGEICVRGPQVMKGYLNRPEATAAMVDPEGWLHTGDIGFADDDGCFFIVDRLKELIKYKGMQIAPAELEAVLLSHPSIADAAVIPIADEECGEVPKAFVVLKATVHAGRHLDLCRGTSRAVQEAARHRDDRSDSEIAVGQDPATGADRTGEGAELGHWTANG